jgi:hypothetical protein
MSRPTRDTAAGRAYLDLQNRARAEGRGTQELLTLYVVERWLARLSASAYAATDFPSVVQAVIDFADRLAKEAPGSTSWDPGTRQWAG